METDPSGIERMLTENVGLLDDLASRRSLVKDGKLCQALLSFLANLEMGEEEAESECLRLLEHRAALSAQLGRDPGLRVAALDYFSNLSKRLRNPRVVEARGLDELLRASKEDQKTGCFNARFLREFTEREIKRSSRSGASVSLLLMDIDRFKLINDRWGHLTGDEAIERFAACLMGCIRMEDIAARFGGDEFAVLMPQTGRIGARSLAERFRARLASAMAGFESGGARIPVTVSGGIATYPLDAADYESLLEAADRALYRAKRLGRDRVFDSLEREAFGEGSPDRRGMRRYRVSKAIPVGIEGLFGGDSGLETEARIVNLSGSGVLLECKASLAGRPAAARLTISPRAGLPPLLGKRLGATVVRNQSETGALKFYLGVRLCDPLAPEEMGQLERLGIIREGDYVEEGSPRAPALA